MIPMHDLTNDPFFRLTGDSEWNACIGPQGHEENYVDGYMEAAMYLSQVVLEKSLHISRDTLVLPILYNTRHAIELTLKFLMKQLYEEGFLHAPPKSNHKIHEHFEALERGRLGDSQMRELIKHLSPFVESLAEIDDDGQQLRYAIDQSGQASLKNRPLANLQVIRSSLVELSDILKRLKTRTQALCDEHKTGTFTAACSRSDLKAMAELLIAFPERRGTEYEQLRRDLKIRYGLGNKTLLDAIVVIEDNRELGSLLGKEFALKQLSDEKVRIAAECWSSIHPPRDPSLPRSSMVSASEIRLEILNAKSSYSAGEELLAQLTTEDLVDLETIFYLSRDRYFPECYDDLYAQKQSEYAVDSNHISKASHLMSKTNFLKEVSRALALLGRRSLSSEIWSMRIDLHSFAA